MEEKSAPVQAIDLTRKVFESVYGNLGLLSFAVDKLTPTNGSTDEESKKWEITCSFYESSESKKPSRYKVSVNLEHKTVLFEKQSKEVKSVRKGLDGKKFVVSPVKKKKSKE
ncbi:hypothetical protein KKB40_05525, partial [Patescibacteria group bacterium]|nr:hypothetical protein [Patescibacteria group bacterium]